MQEFIPSHRQDCLYFLTTAFWCKRKET